MSHLLFCVVLARHRWVAAVIALWGVTPVQAQDNIAALHGTWCGTAGTRPDSGLPVNVRLIIDAHGDTLQIALSLPESRLIDLAVPSPYSDSTTATDAD